MQKRSGSLVWRVIEGTYPDEDEPKDVDEDREGSSQIDVSTVIDVSLVHSFHFLALACPHPLAEYGYM